MTGLDRIVSKIEDEGRQHADAILSEAKAEAERILAEARERAAKKAVALLEKTKDEAARKVSVAKSSAESITRKRYLEIRNAVMNDVISAAYEEIEQMSDADYFDLLFALCVKNIEKSECVLYLNDRDLARCPADFEDRINQTVYETSAVQVAKEPKPIENGFVLVYGDMEVNCTLRAIFDASMDLLKDRLSPMLFD